MALNFGSGLKAAPLTWYSSPSLAEPRSTAVAVLTPSGPILLAGGNPVGAINVLDDGGGTLPPLDTTRIAPGGGLLGSGLIIYGGKESAAADSVMNTVLSYDPSTGDIVTLASMSMARYDMGYAADAAGGYYAIGGLGNNNTLLARMERYDSGSNSWTTLASLPAGRYHFGAVFDGTNLIYTFGGRTNFSAGTETATVLAYDISNNVWESEASMPVTTAGSTAILAPNGKIYVIGGTADGMVTNLVQVYDPALNTWTLATPLPMAVGAASGTVDFQGRLVVLGGMDGSNSNLSTTWHSQQLNIPDAAPVFTSVPAYTPTYPAYVLATYQIPYNYTAVASGNPQPVYALLTGPQGMQIDTNSGLLTWTPQAGQIGTNLVTIQASKYVGSTQQTFTITALRPPLPAPSNLVPIAGEHSLTFSWDPVIPVVGNLTYRVYSYTPGRSGRGGGGPVYRLAVDNLTTNSVTFSGLLLGKTYDYAVTAVAAGVESPYSQVLYITTLSPQPPTNLFLTQLTSTTTSFAWNPSPGQVPIVSYTVTEENYNPVLAMTNISGITNSSFAFYGLAPGSLD